MKIRIELSKLEVAKIRKLAMKLGKEMYFLEYDECMSKDDVNELNDKFTDLLNCDKKSDIAIYHSEVDSNNRVVLNLNIKTAFISSLIATIDVVYIRLIKWFISIKKPVNDFIEKFF